MKTISFSSTTYVLGFILISILGYFDLNAQQTWDLKQCIQYGLENHKTNAIYKGNIEKAKQLTRESVALYLPQIYGDLRVEDFFDLPTQVISDVTDPRFPSDVAIQFGKKYTTTASLEGEQMLYNRFLLVSLRGLKPNMAVANLTFTQNQETLIYNISQAYLQVYILRQQIALLGENEKKFTKQLEIIKLQVEKGVAKKLDANRINVALNNITSQLDVAEGGYEVALNRLKNAIGMDLTDSLALSDTTEIAAFNLPPDVAFAVDNKTEIQLQQNQLKLLDVQKKRIGAGYFPTLSFFARYSAQAYNDEFASAFRTWYDFSSIGFKLSVRIFDGMQKSAQRSQQMINQTNARLNLELSQQGFQLQYQNATAQLQRTRTNMENNQANMALAKDVFDNTALMHQEGVITLSDFLNAETAYKEAQLNYITAMLNYYTAVLDLEKAKGTLPEFYQKL